MHDPSEYELQKPEPPLRVDEKRPAAPWIIAAAVILAAGAAAWFYMNSRQAQDVETTQAEMEPATAAPSAPLGAPVEPIELPPLEETDPLVRELVGALSSHPTVAAWLATDNLIRTFTVVVENIATGANPAQHLRVLRPSGPFRVSEADDELVIDPRSYTRYTSIAAAVDSVDAAGAARLYSMLKPRIEEAYAELGREGSFDRVLEQAIVAMLRTPALDGNVRLVPQGAVYAFDNAAVEGLTPAQKQLVRMGPSNVRVIQRKLRQIALELGIPDARLPR